LELNILLVLVGAFLAPLFSRLLRMPVAVGELLYGLALGMALGDSVAKNTTVSFLSEFGFLILMFLVGLEIDFSLLGTIPRRSIFVYTLYFIAVFSVSVPVSAYFGFDVSLSMVLGLISVGVLILSLRESGLLTKPVGKRLLVLGVVGESVSLLMIVLLHRVGETHSLKELLVDLGITLAFFLLMLDIFKLLKLLLWWFPELIRLLAFGHDTSAMNIRLSLFLMFSLGVLAHSSGVESVVGSFLAGAIVSYFLRDKEDLEHKLSAMGYGFLIPIFFIQTGAKIDMGNFSLEVLKISLLILLLMLCVRYLPSPLLAFAGSSLREVLIVPLLLSYPFTLMIAGVEILSRIGRVSEQMYLSLILSALLSTLLFPWFSKAVLRYLIPSRRSL
jgi:Kef-type K+ transport system membrane component KefB